MHRRPDEQFDEIPPPRRLHLGWNAQATQAEFGQRLDDLDLLLQRIHEHELPQEAFEWYLDLRRYGSVPHAGFGMGVERAVAWLCGLEHIRETIAFPRMLYRTRP